MSLADEAGVEPSSGSQVPEAKPIKRIKTDEPAVAAEATNVRSPAVSHRRQCLSDGSSRTEETCHLQRTPS